MTDQQAGQPPRTSARATLEDIARGSGLSLATVDRVINRRPGVRERTRHHVLQVADRLGYLLPDILAPPHARTSIRIPLDFVLPDGANRFIQDLARQLERWAPMRRDVEIRLHVIEGFNPSALAETLAALQGRSAGVGVTALDHPIVREAIRTLAASGTPVLTLASDITQVPRIAYIGIDNRAAGRLAGQLLGRFLPRGPGKIALFTGSLSYRGHEEREMGFRHILGDTRPELAIAELREVRDAVDRGYAEGAALLGRHPDLGGIYSIGGGVEGIARALEESGRGAEVVLIGHELSEESRRFLLSGTIDAVIDQNARVEAREAIDLLAAHARGTTSLRVPSFRMHAIFRENLPE